MASESRERSLMWRPDELPPNCFTRVLTTARGTCPPDRLPVQLAEHRIKDMVRENVVTAVRAEPGGGKTLLLPKILWELQNTGLKWSQKKPVLVVLKACLACEEAASAYITVENWKPHHIHLRTGVFDPDVKHKFWFSSQATCISVITYGVLWKWF
jgi:hypothetical protein